MKKIELVAHCTPRKNEGKVKFVTSIVIREMTGDSLRAIAWSNKGGRWTAQQALREFKRNPGTFQCQGNVTKEELAMYAAAA